jgi:hypothetical protein
MPDEPDVEGESEARRYQRLEHMVSPDGGRAYGKEPQPRGHSVDVGIHRDDLATEGERQHAGGRLGTDARQRHQVLADGLVRGVVHPGEVEPAFSGPDLSKRLDDPWRLPVGKTTDPDRFDKVTHSGPGQGLPGTVSAPHRRIGPISIGVAGVLRKDGEHELLDGIEAARGIERPVCALQPPVNLSNAFDLLPLAIQSGRA